MVQFPQPIDAVEISNNAMNFRIEIRHALVEGFEARVRLGPVGRINDILSLAISIFDFFEGEFKVSNRSTSFCNSLFVSLKLRQSC